MVVRSRMSSNLGGDVSETYVVGVGSPDSQVLLQDKESTVGAISCSKILFRGSRRAYI